LFSLASLASSELRILTLTIPIKQSREGRERKLGEDKRERERETMNSMSKRDREKV